MTVPTLFVYYTSPTTPTAAAFIVEIAGSIRLGSISGLVGEAELGAVGEGNIVLDDPTSSVGYLSDGIVGLKSMAFVEKSCPVGNQRLYSAYIGPRTYRRGSSEPSGTASSLITGSAREIDVSLSDLNSFLSFRVFAPTADDPTSDFNRPAETDLQRIAAMLTTVDFISTTLFDIGYIPTTGGIALDANDYTGQRPVDVLNDCAQASGRNFWVKYHEATGQLVLWYDKWNSDGSATLAYDSALRLTNVLSEVDGSTTFAADYNASEVLDPSRVVSAVYLPFDNATDSPAYRTLPSTANTFAWRDSIAPSVQVKTLTKANALADRYLVDNSTESARISCTVQLPREYVTGIHEGMRLEVHFTHLPNVSDDFTWTRVLQRTIRQDVETQLYYWLDLELAPISAECPDATAAGYYPPLGGPGPLGGSIANDTPADGVTEYFKAGEFIYQPPNNAAGHAHNVWHFPIYSVADGGSPAGFSDEVSANLGNSIYLYLTGDGMLEILTNDVAANTCYMDIEQVDADPLAIPPGSAWDSVGTNLLLGATADSITLNIVALHPDSFPCSHLVLIHFFADALPARRAYRGVNWIPA